MLALPLAAWALLKREVKRINIRYQLMQRRKFLKGSLPLAATPFLGGCAFSGNGSVKPSLVQNGSVRTSADWGMMDVSVKDGVVTGSKPLSVLSSIPNP